MVAPCAAPPRPVADLPPRLAALAAERPTPPRPPGRSGSVGPLRHLRLLRHDLLSAQPDHLFGAWMAEYRGPFLHSFLVNQPDLAQFILAGAGGAVVKSRRSRAALAALLGHSAFCAEGDAWAAARGAFEAAVAPMRGRAALPAMTQGADRLLAALRARTGSGPVDIEAATARAALDVAFHLTFDRLPAAAEGTALLDALGRFREAAPLGSAAAAFPALGRLGGGIAARRAARDLHRVVAAAFEGCAGDSLAGRLRASQAPDAARAQATLMLLAGHEGTGATLGWALWLLAGAPDLQARVAQEAAALPRTPGAADIARLSVTRDVVRETLRLYPPVPMVAREAARPLVLRGRTVPAGAMITVSPWHLHRHRRLWAAPDAFLPERWAQTGPAAPPRGAFLPFVSGPRGCPGGGLALMETTLMLARVLGAVRVAALTDRPPMPVARLTLRARDGIWLTLAPRDAAGDPGGRGRPAAIPELAL